MTASLPIPTPLFPAPSRTIQLDSAGRIDEDILCRKCGYQLRGLLPNSRCPECGTAVGRSLQGDQLLFCDPEWVGRIASGVNWIVMGVVIGVVLGATAGGLIAAFHLSHWLLHALQMIFALVGLYGYWKYTSPDPSASEQDQQLDARKLVRVCQVSSVFAIPLAPFMERSAPQALSILFSIVVGLIGIVGFYAVFIYTARLAMRIPDETLARSFRTLMWAFTILGALALVIGIVAGILKGGVQGTGSSGLAASAGCFGGIGFLILIIFAIINVLRLRRALLKAAAFAKSTWAAAPMPDVV